MSEEEIKRLERLHDDYRRQIEENKESDEDEWIRIHRTGGGAET